jgi:N-dimethylarginine dimethylaminohydrolase
MHTANVLRCGMDVFMTSNLGRTGNEEGRACVVQALKQVNPQVRIHYVDCEEHLDGYIFFIRPGLLLSRIAKDRLPLFFKNWTIIAVDETAEVYNKVMQYKWKKLNPIVAQEYAWFLQSNPEETLFSLNGLSINETTVMLPGISKSVFTQLEKLGINCVSVDMRALTYWDSGLHCCTSELERIENLEDYS